MKIPKEVVKKIIGVTTTAATTVAPFVIDEINQRKKQQEEEQKKERIYNEQKHNGMIKNASLLFSLVGIALSIIAIKQSNVILSIIGLLSVLAYVVTFLYCIDIIQENKHNTYKVVFLIGGMLMVIVVTLLLF